jgi:2-keto-4-pentenoate hydratase/2-oxohepta-3-ene-1,7-dioic acid hydratase in catechol pathway
MRWARFEMHGKPTYGIVAGGAIQPGIGIPWESWEAADTKVPFTSVKLLPPVIPMTFYAMGLNYVEHVTLTAQRKGVPVNLPPKADVGYRAINALIAHGQPIIIPKDATEEVQYEAEIVVIIGKKAKHLTPKNALDHVFGYTIGNDVSERTWQAGDRTLWRAKNTDTFKPMGPWIETDVDLDKLVTRVRMNGKETIKFPTNNMHFGIVECLVAMSCYLTLHPGDMVWMGTEGHAPNMKHGDTCEIEIEGIGTLSNPVLREL